MKYVLIALGLLAALAVSTAEARPKVSLVGTPETMAFQNREADRLDLTRLTESQLKAFKKKGLLVRLPKSKSVKIDGRLPDKYRYVRPWTRLFIVQLSDRFYGTFGAPLKINSAARTMEYQRKLMRSNGNAARGDTRLKRSSHLTGATIDIAKKNLTARQIAWLRNRILLNEKVGRIEATEEFHQSVFHVMVFR